MSDVQPKVVSTGPKKPHRSASMMFMINNFILLILVLVLFRPGRAALADALLCGLIMTWVNFFLALGAARLRLWTVRGKWRLAGYPLPMIVAWLFATTSYLVIFSWIGSCFWKTLFILVLGFGGSMWDLFLHTRFHILKMDRAKPWQLITYWMALTIAGAVVFLVVHRSA